MFYGKGEEKHWHFSQFCRSPQGLWIEGFGSGEKPRGTHSNAVENPTSKSSPGGKQSAGALAPWNPVSLTSKLWSGLT